MNIYIYISKLDNTNKIITIYKKIFHNNLKKDF